MIRIFQCIPFLQVKQGLSKIKAARIATASLFVLVVGLGLIGEFRYGGICSLGAWKIWGTCPLGYVERSLAARRWLPQWQTALLVVFAVILLGRVFCAWICPTVLIRRVFNGKNGLRPKAGAPVPTSGLAAYSPYAILVGLLAASFVFRFPVFCLFCPIGLFFGSLYAVIRLFGLASPGLELVLFPTMLILELWVLKSWCRSICPVGALLSLVGNLNRFILPKVQKEKCLTSKGAKCGICERACPEGIKLIDNNRRFEPNSCTKCLECYDHCPSKAIKIALFK